MPPLEARVREPAGEPAGALVLLHGRGADEHDLFPLFDLLDPQRRLLGIAPGGPLALPPGGRHWYRLGGIPTPDPATFLGSAALLAELVDGLPFAAGRVVLGGFSQGAVMSFALALGPGRPRPAGVVALSGFLPRVEAWPLTVEGLEALPVAIGHGSLDPVIPVAFGREAQDTLTRAGADVLWRESAVPHTIDPQLLPELQTFLEGAVP